MTMPAARVGDSCAHGGTIIPPGAPTVLIGNMPAARMGDMHVCPMLTGPVPHVGGPIVMGSPTVLIGNLPAARVGDPAVCVGPPDTVLGPGSPVTLIGLGTAVAPVVCSVAGSPGSAAQAFPGQRPAAESMVAAVSQAVQQAGAAPVDERTARALAARHGVTFAGGPPAAALPAFVRELSQGQVTTAAGPGGTGAVVAALAANRSVIVTVDAGVLWNDADLAGCSQSLLVAGVLLDSDGVPQAVLVNDTTPGVACRPVDIATFEAATGGAPMLTLSGPPPA